MLQNENEQAFGVLAVAAEGLRDDVNVWNQKAPSLLEARFDSAVEGTSKHCYWPPNVGLFAIRPSAKPMRNGKEGGFALFGASRRD